MKLRTVLMSMTVLLLTTGYAAAENAERTQRQTCNADANAKGLKGADRKAFLKTCLSGGEAAAKPMHADNDGEMQAAQHDLESARAHLQAAPHDYAGHRHKALENVDRALTQVKEGFKAVAKTEK